MSKRLNISYKYCQRLVTIFLVFSELNLATELQTGILIYRWGIEIRAYSELCATFDWGYSERCWQDVDVVNWWCAISTSAAIQTAWLPTVHFTWRWIVLVALESRLSQCVFATLSKTCVSACLGKLSCM